MLNLQPKNLTKKYESNTFQATGYFCHCQPDASYYRYNLNAEFQNHWNFILDEQEAAIARLKLLMEKLSSIKRSYPFMAAEKRGAYYIFTK